jgi:hypothetical protein
MAGGVFRFRCGRARTAVLAAVLVPALVAIGGCGGGGPSVEMVEGIVNLDGKPVDGAAVFFSPAPGSSGMPAAGQTGSDGRFKLTTVRSKKGGGGAVAGDYVVTVTKVQSDAPPLPSDPSDPNYGKFPPAPGPNDKPKIKYIAPQAYGDAKTSPLKATVGKGSGSFTFELKSDFKSDAKAAGK